MNNFLRWHVLWRTSWHGCWLKQPSTVMYVSVEKRQLKINWHRARKKSTPERQHKIIFPWSVETFKCLVGCRSITEFLHDFLFEFHRIYFCTIESRKLFSAKVFASLFVVLCGLPRSLLFIIPAVLIPCKTGHLCYFMSVDVLIMNSEF